MSAPRAAPPKISAAAESKTALRLLSAAAQKPRVRDRRDHSYRIKTGDGQLRIYP